MAPLRCAENACASTAHQHDLKRHPPSADNSAALRCAQPGTPAVSDERSRARGAPDGAQVGNECGGGGRQAPRQTPTLRMRCKAQKFDFPALPALRGLSPSSQVRIALLRADMSV